MRNSLIATLCVGLLSLTTATEMAAESAEARDAAYDEGWYRDVRLEMWTWEGADPNVIRSVLDRIASSENPRRFEDKLDTVLEYGPGHWTYEFERVGDTATRQAEELQSQKKDGLASQQYFLASTYYTIASYPHLKDKPSRRALEKAFNAYFRGGKLADFSIEEWVLSVDGIQFKAFVHFPARTTDRQLPVVLKTGGMDVLGIEWLPTWQALRATGVAMVAFDQPGTGNDGVFDQDAQKHHEAVLAKVLADGRFASDKIVVWSESLGGWPAVKVAVTREDYLSAVVNSCGLLHSVHALEIAPLPDGLDLSELVAAYKQNQLSSEEIDNISNAFNQSPAFRAQQNSFQFEVYVDRIAAKSFSVFDVLSKSLDLSLVNQGVIGHGIKTDVPILSINTQADPIVPTRDSVMATQVTRRGTLQLYGDHEGHCVSRQIELEAVLTWLDPYLD